MSIKLQVVNEIHKPARKNYKHRRTVIKGLHDLWQIDLAEFQDLASQNKNYKYLLVVINCFSKYVWTRPLKNKTGECVTEAMGNILSSTQQHAPANIQSDQGKEFFNAKFSTLMKKYGINHYCTFGTKKAAIVERVIRTIKGRLYKQMNFVGTPKWIDLIDGIVTDYNNTVHRTIHMKPINVSAENESSILTAVYSNMKIYTEGKYKVGQWVRISKMKHIFAKGYTPNWTTELFKIVRIKHSTPVMYYLEDRSKQPIQGGFYEEEIQPTKHSDVYLIEKVIRKKGSKLLVKWLGFDNSKNSWIKKSDIV